MERLSNIRIHTLCKSFPTMDTLVVVGVKVVNNHIIIVADDDTTYDLGVVSATNIVANTPVDSPCEKGGNVARSNVLATLLRGIDGNTQDLSEYYKKSEVDGKLKQKQDTISNLDTIRANAEKGATALQSVPEEYVTETELNNKGYLTDQSLKTINSQSIVGSGNIVIESGEANYQSAIENKDLAMPNNVGGIDKDTKVKDLEGKSYNEMFDILLFPTVNPTFIMPSASIAFKNYSSLQEVGTSGPTANNFTVSYNAGAITLNGVKQANYGGTHDEINSFIFVNNSASNKDLPTEVKLGNTTFKYRAAYNEGPQPKNSKGDNYGSPLAAGTVDSSSITLNGTYPWYASTSSATSTNPVIKQSLVAWDTTEGNMSTGQFTVQPSGILPQVFKLPRQIKTLQLKNALNGQMEDVANIAIDYTESTETINIGGKNITYYVYTYKGSTRGSVTLLAKF